MNEPDKRPPPSTAELAATYVRQRANVDDLIRTTELAEVNLRREQASLAEIEGRLRALITPDRLHILIPVGFSRYVLVHTLHGGCGCCILLNIIEESK